MSVGTKLLQAAAGNAGEAVYVDDVFSTTLYVGTDGSVVVPTGLDLADKGGMIWGKSRSASQNHRWYDSARGTQYSLISNSTAIQSDQGTQTFGSSSVTLGAASGIVGSSSYGGPDYVLWSFAKQEKFFDIVTYTGDGNADRQINHNLGSVPGMMIIKKYVGSTTRWAVFHRSLGTGKFLSLDDTAGVVTQSDFWQTAPTATQFTVETNGNVNNNGDSYVAYLFAHNDGDGDYGEGGDEDIIKCGTYTGSGSTGKFVDLGFEPQWVLVKNTDAGTPWVLIDTMRGMVVDGDGVRLLADQSVAEVSSASYFAPRPTGMEVTQQNTYVNTSGQNYVYMAIRRPNKPASEFAATELFDTNLTTSDSLVQTSLTRTDFNIQKARGDSTYFFAQSRLTGNIKYLRPNATTVEADYSSSDPVGVFDTQGQVRSYMGSDSNVIWSFMRAKGFFDVVTYQGTGSFTWFNHNLGVVPELIIFKARNYGQHWNVFTTQGGTTSRLKFNDNGSSITTNQNQFWVNLPTATQFRIGSSDEINGSSYKYIAYFFATVAGISKVGSYTGTSSDLNVDCGFSAGARFVFIKRTDSNGDWYLYDSERGIVAGNDPYVRSNTSSAEVTNTDYIDPLSSGFTVTSSAPADLNASSGTYIFLAIA